MLFYEGNSYVHKNSLGTYDNEHTMFLMLSITLMGIAKFTGTAELGQVCIQKSLNVVKRFLSLNIKGLHPHGD